MYKPYYITIDSCGVIKAELIDENTTQIVVKFIEGISCIQEGHWEQATDEFMILKKSEILIMTEAKK